jgi:hypothetical protein
MSQVHTLKPKGLKNFSLSLTTRRVFDEAVNEILSENPTQPVYVNITPKPKKRSLPANAQQHVFYKQISEFTDTDLKTVEAECKIDFGLPIILADREIGPVIGHALQSARFFTMTRERQVRFIQIIQITSLMSTKQHNQYRDNIIFYWNKNGLPLQYLEKEAA